MNYSQTQNGGRRLTCTVLPMKTTTCINRGMTTVNMLGSGKYRKIIELTFIVYWCNSCTTLIQRPKDSLFRLLYQICNALWCLLKTLKSISTSKSTQYGKKFYLTPLNTKSDYITAPTRWQGNLLSLTQ